jgi:hypothetical protein
MINELNEDKRYRLSSLGKGKQYTKAQKFYAFERIGEHGVRATARILQIPHKTLQRLCRQYGIYVRRCPSWVYEWAKSGGIAHVFIYEYLYLNTFGLSNSGNNGMIMRSLIWKKHDIFN